MAVSASRRPQKPSHNLATGMVPEMEPIGRILDLTVIQGKFWGRPANTPRKHPETLPSVSHDSYPVRQFDANVERSLESGSGKACSHVKPRYVAARVAPT